MDPRLQSPAIGQALRERLALDGAGAISLEMASTVVPVAIVANVEPLVTSVPRWNHHVARNFAAGVGRFARCALQWQAGILPRPVEINVRRLRMWSNTAQEVHVGWPATPMAPNTQGLPRRNLWSLRLAQTAGRVVFDDVAAGPTVGNAQIVSVAANVVYEMTWAPGEVILDQESAEFGAFAVNSNTALTVSVEWTEDFRD